MNELWRWFCGKDRRHELWRWFCGKDHRLELWLTLTHLLTHYLIHSLTHSHSFKLIRPIIHSSFFIYPFTASPFRPSIRTYITCLLRIFHMAPIVIDSECILVHTSLLCIWLSCFLQSRRCFGVCVEFFDFQNSKKLFTRPDDAPRAKLLSRFFF